MTLFAKYQRNAIEGKGKPNSRSRDVNSIIKRVKKFREEDQLKYLILSIKFLDEKQQKSFWEYIHKTISKKELGVIFFKDLNNSKEIVHRLIEANYVGFTNVIKDCVKEDQKTEKKFGRVFKEFQEVRPLLEKRILNVNTSFINTLNAGEYFSLLDFVNDESSLKLFNIGGTKRIKRLKDEDIKKAIVLLKKIRYVDKKSNFKKLFFSIGDQKGFRPKSQNTIKMCEKLKNRGLIFKQKAKDSYNWNISDIGWKVLNYISEKN
jgi:hypothetical protein